MIAVLKGDEIFPDSVLRSVCSEPVVVAVGIRIVFMAIPTYRYMFIKFTNVAEGLIVHIRVYPVEIVDFVRDFFRHVATAFLVANEPNPRMP